MRIDKGVRQEFILSPWLFNVYMDAVIKKAKRKMGRRVEIAWVLVCRGLDFVL